MASIQDLSFRLFYKYMHYTLCMLVVFLVVLTIGNLQVFISKQTLSKWDEESPVLVRFLGNFAVLGLFVLQHSAMATERFKAKLATWLNITVSERLVYVTCTCITLMLLIIKWQSIPETYLWFIDTQQRSLLWLFFLLLHAAGWFVLGLQVLLVDFGEMVGVHQVYQYHNSLSPPLTKMANKLREIYSRMRHPGAVLLTAMLWIHPLMTLDRVILACTLTSYVIGRHSLNMSHYEFAEKYFSVQFSEKRSTSSVRFKKAYSNYGN